ncbi:MAG TPA: FAD binding domain-containing protein [Acidimicrobiales bacterium]|nr:FAD binding domain-containing protein [Acidimicrobiales bacterium]
MRAARVALPTTVDEAVEALTATPGAQLLAGGTDFCVEVNFGLRRPPAVVALRRVLELRRHAVTPERVILGAGTTYADMGGGALADALPALAAAARTVGSPQIRNAGTLGGNVATASPAGDTLPLLCAMDARVTLRGPAGERTLPLGDVVTGVKRTAIAPDEVVVAVELDRRPGPQQFLKVGTRNAMVIAIASVAVAVDIEAHRVRAALGSVAPVPVRATAAEEHIADAIDWRAPGLPTAPASAVARFGELAAQAASPITDHRSTEAYRRRAVEVIARRALERCLSRAA